MSNRRLAWLRWLALVPLALFATVVVQIGSNSIFHSALLIGFGRQTWTAWASKVLASSLMGAVFVSMIWWLAPKAKVVVSTFALAAVIFWGVTLMVDSFQRGFFVWLFGTGLSGVIGASFAFEALRRSLVARVA